MPQINPTQLRTALSKLFSTGELRTLCFDLGIDYEDLEGAGKSGKALALVQYGQRHGRYDELVYRVQQLRPRSNLGTAVPAPPNIVSQQGPNHVTNVYVGGDYVEGDKTGGDNITNSTTGDTFNMSGDFRGSNVNIKSTLTNVNQTIGALPNADDAAKAELQKLIAQLHEALQQAPADKADDADAVAQMAETFIETANSEKPNKMILQITGEGLKKAAENLAAIVPDVVKIAGAIVAGILGLG